MTDTYRNCDYHPRKLFCDYAYWRINHWECMRISGCKLLPSLTHVNRVSKRRLFDTLRTSRYAKLLYL